jgi:uncharacterized repeat protein (TIGR02543 family)
VRHDYVVHYDLTQGTYDGRASLQSAAGLTLEDAGLLPDGLLFEAGKMRRAGWAFTGWKAVWGNPGATASRDWADDSARSLKYGELAAPDEDPDSITLVAQWVERRDYKVAYELDGGQYNGSGTVADRDTLRWGDSGLLPSDGSAFDALDMAYPGATRDFVGWKVDSTGALYPGDAADSLAYSVLAGGVEPANDTLELTAVWGDANANFVTYDLAGGTCDGKTSADFLHDVKADATDILPHGTIAKVGYELDGWVVSAGGPAVAATGAERYGDLADSGSRFITLRAQWKAKTGFKVSYDLGGGTYKGNPADLAERDGLSWDGAGDLLPGGAAFRTYNMAKPGHAFAGWLAGGGTVYPAASANAKTYGELALVDDPNVLTLVAQWTERDDYFVTYDLAGGSYRGSSDALDALSGVHWTQSGLLPDGASFDTSRMTKGGYVFAGWTGPDGTAYPGASANAVAYSQFVTAGTDPASAKLTARWVQGSTPADGRYIVEYNLDGGFPYFIHCKTVDYDDSGLLPLANLSKPGFDFDGWKVTEGGKALLPDIPVDTRTKYSDLAEASTSFITLTAQWKAMGGGETPGGGVTPVPPVVTSAAKVTAFGVTQKTVYVKKGKSVKLPFVAYTDAAGPQTLTWKASKSKVASVAKGKAAGVVSVPGGADAKLAIKAAKKVGTSKITLTAASGAKLVLTVKVVKKAKAASKNAVKVKGAPKKMKVGQSKVAKVKLPKGATVIATWKSSKKAIVKVDAAGKLTALKKGKVKLTLKVGKVKKVVKIKVS